MLFGKISFKKNGQAACRPGSRLKLFFPAPVGPSPSWNAGTRLTPFVQTMNHRESNALELFIRLVTSGDSEALDRAFTEFPVLRHHVNDPLFAFDSPALREAVNRKDRRMIDVLLDAGADINTRSAWKAGGFGVLDLVDPELGEYLISRGATVTIHAAANLGKTDVLTRLLREDRSLVNARGGDGGTPLHFARNVEVVEILLGHGADVTIRDVDHGSTAAMWQIRDREVLFRLIEAGSAIDIFMACRQGDRTLAQRALAEDPDCLSAVVGRGKFTRDTGGDIYTWCLVGGARPLGVASHFGHAELVEDLLPFARPADELIFRCTCGEEEKAREVLGKSPGLLDRLTESDLAAFPNALWFGNEKCVRSFLTLGFPVTGRGQDDGTALHMAAWLGDPAMVGELLSAGLDIEDAGDVHGSTPLAWALHGAKFSGRAGADHPGVVKALLAAGADPSKPANKYGGTLADWATPEIAEILGNHAAANARQDGGVSP